MNANSPTVPPVITPPSPAIPSVPPPRFKFLLAAAVWLCVVLAGIGVTWILPEMYASTALILAVPDATEVSPSTNLTTYAPVNDAIFLQTQRHMIASEAVLALVVDALDLTSVWGKKYYGDQKLTTSECVALLRARLDVRFVTNTKIMAIRVYSESAQEAATLANAVVQAYDLWRAESMGRHAPQKSWVVIADKAVPAVKPERPNIRLNTFLSIVTGALFGAMVALLVYLLHWRAYRRKIEAADVRPPLGLHPG